MRVEPSPSSHPDQISQRCARCRHSDPSLASTRLPRLQRAVVGQAKADRTCHKACDQRVERVVVCLQRRTLSRCQRYGQAGPDEGRNERKPSLAPLAPFVEGERLTPALERRGRIHLGDRARVHIPACVDRPSKRRDQTSAANRGGTDQISLRPEAVECQCSTRSMYPCTGASVPPAIHWRRTDHRVDAQQPLRSTPSATQRVHRCRCCPHFPPRGSLRRRTRRQQGSPPVPAIHHRTTPVGRGRCASDSSTDLRRGCGPRQLHSAETPPARGLILGQPSSQRRTTRRSQRSDRTRTAPCPPRWFAA